MKPKTPQVRAIELFRMVTGVSLPIAQSRFRMGFNDGWLRLGKFVLSLETKWAGAKRNQKQSILAETVLRLVNEAEGCFLIGKISNGKVLLADAKSILENMVDRHCSISNTKTCPRRSTAQKKLSQK